MANPAKIEGEKTPLTGGEVEAYRGVFDDVDGSNELIGRVALETGLSRSEMAHLTDEWIIPDSNLLKIRVPPGEQECRAGRDPPCPHCCQKRDGIWSSHRLPRTVPLFNDETAGLLQSLLRHRDTLGSVDKIQDSIQWISENAGIERGEGDIQVKTVTNTFITKLLNDGFGIAEICRLMGYKDQTEYPGSTTSFVKIRNLGEFCESGNPFVCDAELSQDSTGKGGRSRCIQPVLFRDQRCGFHDDWEPAKCRSVTSDGSVCQKPVSDAKSRCEHHSDGGLGLCGAELDDGSQCQRVASSSSDYCTQHEDWQPPICGYSLDDGSVCQRWVSEYDYCLYHRDSHQFSRCGESLEGDGCCTVQVSNPDEKCHYHREG